jgi:hypothetical protein
MTLPIDPSKVIAAGTWLYAGEVPCRVVIQREDVWPGFFDPQDHNEERAIPCVSVWCEHSTGGFPDEFPNSYHHTLDEARAELEKLLPNPIQWDPVE